MVGRGGGTVAAHCAGSLRRCIIRPMPSVQLYEFHSVSNLILYLSVLDSFQSGRDSERVVFHKTRCLIIFLVELEGVGKLRPFPINIPRRGFNYYKSRLR